MIPNVVSIAGVDPSGGAGVLADLKAFSALGAYGCAVITALTAQNTQRVDGVSMVDTDFVTQQINTLFDDVRIDAIKVGMLGTAALTRTVAAALRSVASGVPIVLDPVMIAKSGDPLLQPDAVAALREQMLPLATVLTPNLPEAGELLDSDPPATLAQMRNSVQALHEQLGRDGAWVLLKGGHLDGAAIDLLSDGQTVHEFESARIDTKNTHGTGCTLSSAIAALLPVSPDVPSAVEKAKQYLTRAIVRSSDLSVGSGHGPVHHFHNRWS